MPRLSLAKLERHLYAAADRLRQEGLDAATYKDYIFGMLFLKRCSDVFDAENEKIVGRKVEQGMEVREARAQYGENSDYDDGFFVPECARWDYLQVKLNDATESYGGVLDKALSALSDANDLLEHVLDHIQFLRTQGIPYDGYTVSRILCGRDPIVRATSPPRTMGRGGTAKRRGVFPRHPADGARCDAWHSARSRHYEKNARGNARCVSIAGIRHRLGAARVGSAIAILHRGAT
jgi:HsdM N-terminal domain